MHLQDGKSAYDFAGTDKLKRIIRESQQKAERERAERERAERERAAREAAERAERALLESARASRPASWSREQLHAWLREVKRRKGLKFDEAGLECDGEMALAMGKEDWVDALSVAKPAAAFIHSEIQRLATGAQPAAAAPADAPAAAAAAAPAASALPDVGDLSKLVTSMIGRRQLGGGAHSVVVEGVWRNQVVAVKVARFDNPRQLRRLQAEAELHAAAARLRRIIRPLAQAVDEENSRFYLVLQLAEKGSLERAVAPPRGELAANDATWELVRVLAEAAHGLAALHSVGILHRDVAPRNIVLDSQLGAFVCDLGYARELVRGKDYAQSTTVAAPTETPAMWACAIDRASGRFTAASDVFMFGLTMWEALARGAPLLGDKAMPRAEVAQRLAGGQRPAALPEAQCPEGVRKLIVRCLEADAARRPGMEEVAEALKEEYVRSRVRADYVASWERMASSVATKAEVEFLVRRLQQREDEAQ
jgi:predicted Ser/Thr protein kinase